MLEVCAGCVNPTSRGLWGGDALRETETPSVCVDGVWRALLSTRFTIKGLLQRSGLSKDILGAQPRRVLNQMPTP